MRPIRISEEVWQAIAESGKFGETEDDVLRRVFGLEPATRSVGGPGAGRIGRGNRRLATKRMSARVEKHSLIVDFHGGPRHEWRLPNQSNKGAIKKVRSEAVQFALKNGASDPGQTNAVRKALTDAGYHLTK